MSERATIAFADAAAEVAGVALPGVGTLLSVGDKLTAAPAPQLSGGGSAWTLSAPGAYALSLEALAGGSDLADGATVWLCRARGTVEGRELDALATITAVPAAEDFELERCLSIALDHELSFALLSHRPRGAGGHGEEQLEAVVFRGDPPVSSVVSQPRLSTTYDGGGQPGHAGVELWEDEESEYALRIGGESLTNGELVHADGARSRVVFMAWHHKSHRALGSYTLTTAAAAG
jgi:hypothetical protein